MSAPKVSTPATEIKEEKVPVSNMSTPAPQTHDAKVPAFAPPAFAPPAYAPPANSSSGARRRPHTNAVIEAGHLRARDEVSIRTYAF